MTTEQRKRELAAILRYDVKVKLPDGSWRTLRRKVPDNLAKEITARLRQEQPGVITRIAISAD